MRQRTRKSKASAKPEWATKIAALREQLRLNQTSFGRKLRTSAMAVSRWERGAQEPPSHSYIEVGNLAGDPLCWYFWARAGLRSEHLMSALPARQKRLREARNHDFEIVGAGSGKKKSAQKQQLVAIPVLRVLAASHGTKGDNVEVLRDAPVDSMIAAPQDWCPRPATTSCLRVKGDSMAPTICDGYVVAVDSSQTDRDDLDGKIVIAWEKNTGLTVSRFKRYGDTETLQSENPQYKSITLGQTKEKWMIVATVLWWVGKAP